MEGCLECAAAALSSNLGSSELGVSLLGQYFNVKDCRLEGARRSCSQNRNQLAENSVSHLRMK